MRPSWVAASPSTRSRSGLAERVVGALQVGERGVAPDRWDHDPVEQRSQGRVGHERHIGVPGVVLPLVLVPLVGARPGGVDLQHLGMIGIERREHRVGGRERSEETAGSNELVGREVL